MRSTMRNDLRLSLAESWECSTVPSVRVHAGNQGREMLPQVLPKWTGALTRDHAGRPACGSKPNSQRVRGSAGA